MDPHLDAVVDYVTQKTGLALSPAQLTELKDYLRQRQSLTAGTEFIARLADPAEFRMLVDCLTVKETFFYRYEAQFDAFRDHLLPQLLARARGEGRPVRVWSAGCCTGEEAYTLALIASESGCLDHVHILATDINEGYLESAMEGVFSKRSVEKLPPALLHKYFAAKQDRFVLADSLKTRVTFKWLNLAEPSYPSFLNGTSAIDLVFCRNVLIYFDKSKVRDIVERFAACLNPGGLIAFGHSEILPPDWPLSVQPIGEAFFYRDRRRTTRPIKPAVVPPAGPNPQALLDEAERHANHGNSGDAARLCRDAIALDASLERGHYLLGLLSLDSPLEAHEHFRKAVYLDPAHLPARLHLAECAEKMGRIPEAVLEYQNLERLARAKPPEEILDPLEGITYGMLALIGRTALDRDKGGSR